MRPISNFAARDVEALLHPTTNLLAHRSSGPLVLERAEGAYLVSDAGMGAPIVQELAERLALLVGPQETCG